MEALPGIADGRMPAAAQDNSLATYAKKLEKKEDDLKADGKVSDRDREKLLEDARDIWRDLVKALK